MADPSKPQRAEAEAELEKEIRAGRKFSLAEAIGRLAGPGAMKGASPTPRLRQAELEIGSWLRSHLVDAAGALELVLHRRVKDSDLLLNNYDQPLVVLAAYCRRVLDSDYDLQNLVRDVDIEWGRVMEERPHFDRGPSSHDPDDPYTIESVRRALSELLKDLALTEP